MNDIHNQAERRLYLIRALIGERAELSGLEIPYSSGDQRRLLRALFNTREPLPVSDDFLRVQDEYLKAAIAEKGITCADDLEYSPEGIAVWRGDITTLKCDAIVNAANSQLLGCFCPNHGCIDNAIHTYAGVQLRLKCAEIMSHEEHDEPTGRARITPAYNLPSRYVLHTVGPIITGDVTDEDCALLKSCYKSCLDVAADANLQTIALCCISTGEFHFPAELAARIAIDTVRGHEAVKSGRMRAIFNVFKESDERIYRTLLSSNT